MFVGAAVPSPGSLSALCCWFASVRCCVLSTARFLCQIRHRAQTGNGWHRFIDFSDFIVPKRAPQAFLQEYCRRRWNLFRQFVASLGAVKFRPCAYLPPPRKNRSHEFCRATRKRGHSSSCRRARRQSTQDPR